MPKKINVKEAVAAYFDRVASGSASDAEIAILPEMLERYDIAQADTAPQVSPEQAEMFAGMSDEGKRGDFPMEGLVNAYEVCQFIGKKGIKNHSQSLIALAKSGRFPMPHESYPYRWLAQDVRQWIGGLMTSKPTGRKSAA